LGIKPLYLCNDGRRLVFASEAKAILALPGMHAELDPAALSSYLELGYVPAPQSIFRGIRKLPPATLLSAERGKIGQRRYWQVPAEVDRAPSEGEWVARVRERLEESVRMQVSIPALWWPSWRRTASGRSRPTPSVSAEGRPRIITTSFRMREK
jgi:asparagine synthase (glutamine-hydrolysing)